MEAVRMSGRTVQCPRSTEYEQSNMFSCITADMNKQPSIKKTNRTKATNYVVGKYRVDISLD